MGLLIGIPLLLPDRSSTIPSGIEVPEPDSRLVFGEILEPLPGSGAAGKGLLSSDIEWRSLPGHFALVSVAEDEANLFTDHAATHPLYVAEESWGLLVSDDLGKMVPHLETPRLDPSWLSQFLYFNYPLGETTFLDGVRRLPAATHLHFDRRTGAIVQRRWKALLDRPDRFLDANESRIRATEVFADRIPRYLTPPDEVALSLTGGFDSRTLLAFAPESLRREVLTYTYGVEGCGDLLDAGEIARRLGLRHEALCFDGTFEEELPRRIWTTVQRSGGCERILRATLDRVYEDLARGRSIAVTGVSGDNLFRDHLLGRGNVPAIIPPAMMDHLQGRSPEIDRNLLASIYAGESDAALGRVQDSLDAVWGRWGEGGQALTFQRYLVYEVAPRYFGGEAALARHHLRYRAPFWDPEILALAFELSLGVLGLSTFLPGKDPYRESVLQASAILSQPGMARVPMKGVSLAAYAGGRRWRYQLERLVRRGPGKVHKLVRPPRRVPLEDWEGWWQRTLRAPCSRLLGDDSRLAGHVDRGWIVRTLDSGDLHWIGKAVTAEIVLRLLENRWELPAEAGP